MANMKDLAKAAGVSLATISRVFNESEKVKPATRKKVLDIAQKLNYRPNQMAAALRRGKSDSIGVVVPIIDREVFSSAIKSMEEVLSEAGYNIIICQSRESYVKEKQIIDNLKQLKVAGIIISTSKETKKVDHLLSLQDEGIPVIFFDRNIEVSTINSVVINNYNGAYQATQHLIEQGCTRLLHLAGKEEVVIFQERKRGFLTAVSDNATVVDSSTVIPFDDGQLTGIHQLKSLLNDDKHPDGILANGDIAALVALRIIQEMELKIPQDIAIVGFGDSQFCTYLQPSLSSVNQRNEDIGKLTATTLLKEIKEEDNEQVVIQQMLPPILSIRASSLRHSGKK